MGSRRDALRLLGSATAATLLPGSGSAMTEPDLILTNGRLSTLDRANPVATAAAIANGRFVAVGTDREIAALAGPATRTIDLGGHRAIPGLNDSHTHLIRGGLNYMMELRWDGVPTLADAMAMLKAQVAITPPPQWVRVVGGFSALQFREKRLPTLDEINALAPETPVFILHLYDRALLNRAALRAVGYTRETPDPPGGEIQRDGTGNPTGLLIARPNALILYATLAKGPKLAPEDQLLSTRHFMRELNRLGITSVIDAGGGFQNYPQDYAIIEKLNADGELTVRIAYNLFTQNAGREREDFARWTDMVRPGDGSAMFRHNGAGEMLVFSAADFEDFREPRPDLPARMEADLEEVVRLLVGHRWPFRIHGTYDESISRFLDVFERVHRDMPFDGLRFTIDHAETISDRSIERVAALGGGIAIQHRMAYQGDWFVARYGAAAAEATPPVRRMLDMGVPVGGGTDATRVASYNPWVGMWWLVSGKALGGTALAPVRNRLSREEALSLYTCRSAWFSGEEEVKGRLAAGQYADLAVLSEDLMGVDEERIAGITSLLTLVGGRIVHATGPFAPLAPPAPPVSPDWSPVARHGGYQHGAPPANPAPASCCASPCVVHGHQHGRAWGATVPARDLAGFWGVLGCACFAA